MTFDEPLIGGKILKRYKRFLADIEFENGTVETVHCPNSGSMKGCWEPGWRAMISDSKNPKRKLRCTLEMTHNGTCWIGVNTQHPNRIAYDAVKAASLPELPPFADLKREVKYGTNSRVDLFGTTAEGENWYIEVKNVTLVGDDNTYQFPDAVTTRGQKHLDELIQCVSDGDRAAMLFVIQRSDGEGFRAAESIDPVYAEKLVQAQDAGVIILPYLASVSPDEIILTESKVDFLR